MTVPAACLDRASAGVRNSGAPDTHSFGVAQSPVFGATPLAAAIVIPVATAIAVSPTILVRIAIVAEPQAIAADLQVNVLRGALQGKADGCGTRQAELYGPDGPTPSS